MTEKELKNAVKKKGEYLDCHTCIWQTNIYDRNKRVTGHWCAKRNGRLRKRFRGDCRFVTGGEEE